MRACILPDVTPMDRNHVQVVDRREREIGSGIKILIEHKLGFSSQAHAGPQRSLSWTKGLKACFPKSRTAARQ